MVTSTFLRSKAARGLPFLLAAILFSGCGLQQSTDQSTEYFEGSAQADSGYYLQQMQQSSDDSKTNWQLLAIRALLKEGQKSQAIALYKQLPEDLNDQQLSEQALLGAEISLAGNNITAARAQLSRINVSGLAQNQQERYWQNVITAQQGRSSLTLLRALIARQPLLITSQDKQKNIDATWLALTSMSQQQAHALVINADENVLQGWLDLQQTWFDNRNDPAMMKAGILDWQSRYPQNPGSGMLPTQLTNVENFKPASTHNIALLLPLNGQAAIFGRTIQQGFEAAKAGSVGDISGTAVPEQSAQAANIQQDEVVSPSQVGISDLLSPPQQSSPLPEIVQQAAQVPSETTPPRQDPAAETPSASAPTAPAAPSSAGLKIYDTTTAPLDQILNQAQQDGSSLVVGPLLKNDVETLVKNNSSLNVLALNLPENIENRINICYFALSPEDEARDAARHIHEQGKQAPLLLIPRSALGDRVSKAFAQEWQSLGGGVVLQQQFGSLSSLRGGVNGGSVIALTGTPISTSQPEQRDVTIGDLNIPAPQNEIQATSGGAVDAAYIIATPEEIAYIKPMIAMRNGSQSRVTLYASSRSAQGTSGPDFRLEMEGLQYSEIPMLAGSNPVLMQQALNAVHNDYSLARLYAMGVDAWTLANHFLQMRQVQGFELNGNTGDLTASQDCVINRKLSWLKYQQGQVVPAS